MSDQTNDDVTRALIFANGDLNDGPALQAALAHAPDALIIAADGGARLAAACDLRPALIVGDMDSLSPGELDDWRAQNVTIQQHPPAKDETDLELTLLAAVARGVTWMRIIGGVGDRLDQTLANLYLLLLADLAGRDVRLVSGRQTVWLLASGAHTLRGRPGDTISLLPLEPGTDGITTEGLAFPLRDEALQFGPARGVSNVLEGESARVRLAAGRLIVVHTVGEA